MLQNYDLIQLKDIPYKVYSLMQKCQLKNAFTPLNTPLNSKKSFCPLQKNLEISPTCFLHSYKMFKNGKEKVKYVRDKDHLLNDATYNFSLSPYIVQRGEIYFA